MKRGRFGRGVQQGRYRTLRQASVGSSNGRRQENVVNVAGQAGDGGCKCDGWMAR